MESKTNRQQVREHIKTCFLEEIKKYFDYGASRDSFPDLMVRLIDEMVQMQEDMTDLKALHEKMTNFELAANSINNKLDEVKEANIRIHQSGHKLIDCIESMDKELQELKKKWN